MARRPNRLHRRPFREISVGVCRVQSSLSRFGKGAPGLIREREQIYHYDSATVAQVNDLQTDQDGPRSALRAKIPHMQRYRNNLTALSQKYNLYFAAYGDYIYAYRPRNILHHLPQEPDLKIQVKPTRSGSFVGGYINVHCPEFANHLIVGPFGDDEVVVASYDNGDVVAYYTHEIAAMVAGSLDASHVLRPLLHDNTGISAWGLATHGKSRLIAVSTNQPQVIVYAFALASSRTHRHWSQYNPTTAAEAVLRTRGHDVRIMVTLGPAVQNLPSIAFLDDKHGEAELVCGMDISGVCWIASIWRAFTPVVCISHHGTMTKASHKPAKAAIMKGWGVLAIRRRDFLPVHTLDELVGMPRQDLCFLRRRRKRHFWASINNCMYDVVDNPCLPSNYKGHMLVKLGGKVDSDYQNDGIVEGLDCPSSSTATTLGGGDDDDDDDDGDDDDDDDDDEYYNDEDYDDGNDQIHTQFANYYYNGQDPPPEEYGQHMIDALGLNQGEAYTQGVYLASDEFQDHSLEPYQYSFDDKDKYASDDDLDPDTPCAVDRPRLEDYLGNCSEFDEVKVSVYLEGVFLSPIRKAALALAYNVGLLSLALQAEPNLPKRHIARVLNMFRAYFSPGALPLLNPFLQPDFQSRTLFQEITYLVVLRQNLQNMVQTHHPACVLNVLPPGALGHDYVLPLNEGEQPYRFFASLKSHPSRVRLMDQQRRHYEREQQEQEQQEQQQEQQQQDRSETTTPATTTALSLVPEPTAQQVPLGFDRAPFVIGSFTLSLDNAPWSLERCGGVFRSMVYNWREFMEAARWTPYPSHYIRAWGNTRLPFPLRRQPSSKFEASRSIDLGHPDAHVRNAGYRKVQRLFQRMGMVGQPETGFPALTYIPRSATLDSPAITDAARNPEWPDKGYGSPRVRGDMRAAVAMGAVLEQYNFLRAYAHNVEFSGFHQAQPGVSAADVLPLTFEARAAAITTLQAHTLELSKRLSLVAHVPQLALMVVGSASGRVALLTVTGLVESADAKERICGDRGMRLDRILPSAADERAGRKPLHALFGIAVGPVPRRAAPGPRQELFEDHDEAGHARMERPRVRLMLHYRDHTILTYELSRDESHGDMLVVE